MMVRKSLQILQLNLIVLFMVISSLVDGLVFAVTPQVFEECKYSRNADLAIKSCSEVINDLLQLGKPMTWPLINRGVAYRHKRDFSVAIGDFSSVLRQFPSNVVALLERGDTFLQAQDLESALADYNSALSLDARNPRAHAGIAILLAKRGKFAEAASENRLALNADQNFTTSLVNIGGNFLSNGDLEKAHESYQAALVNRNRLSPKEKSIVYFGLGRVAAERNNLDEAIQEYSLAIASDYNFAAAYDARSKIYKSMGKFEKAGEDSKSYDRLK